MSKPEDENRSSPPKSKEKEKEREATVMMDLDMDLDNSWTFDQIFAPEPTSHFLLSAADQPCSPLWAFSDEQPGDDHRLSEYTTPLSSSCNPDLVIEGRSRNDDVRKVPPPVLGFMPLDYSDGSCVIKERMTQALRYFKESTEQHVLAQLWAPVKSGDRYVLTTLGQPFVLDPNSNGLHQYRMVSLKYMFSVDGESDGGLGLPGRVFRQKLPEWTPNVQYYSSKEYPRLNHALHYNVRGTLALPVFEPYGQSCVGVFELIMTSQKVNYAPEVDKVCKALEAVNLKSSDILDHPNTQICNEGRQNALVEILEILTLVCETHNLPLAQTWVPCRHRSVLAYGGGLKKSCSSFDGSCMGQVCMSTTDVAFYVVNAHMWGFREACSEHHLLKGQGVAGRAFSSQGSCFCEDITQFCKTEYPLVHYARMFGLSSSFAICLRSTHTGNDDYILEFFIPPNVVDSNNQQASLNSLLATMKKHFRSLKVASGKELDEEGGSVEIIKASMEEKQLDTSLESVQVPQSTIHPHVPDSLPNRGEMAHLDTLEQQKMVGSGAVHSGRDVSDAGGVQNGVSPSKNKDAGKKSEKKRGKAEKSISLEVLQQYFAGSLKDAAKSLGVCPTTMKRICRQHGISRWPSRKINKVNRSLSKLKRVIESVQGAEGTFTLASLATSSLPAGAAGGSISWPAGLNGSNQQNSSPVLKPNELPEGPTHKMLGDGLLHYNELINVQTELGEGSNPSKTGSGSQEEGTSSPTSSCPGVESSPPKEQRMNMGGLFELARQPIEERHVSVAFSIPNVTNAAVAAVQPEATFRGMLIEDVGSSHDLTNLCPAGEALLDERVPESSWTNHVGPKEPSIANPADDRTLNILTGRPELKTVTIKATYREDIIRFRLSLDSGFVKLKEEVAKRLKLEMDTFDIKYLDDDHEWVLIACDADLEECMDISISSGINIIRLIVHDIMANLGSSCESSGELGG